MEKQREAAAVVSRFFIGELADNRGNNRGNKNHKGTKTEDIILCVFVSLWLIFADIVLSLGPNSESTAAAQPAVDYQPQRGPEH